MTKKIIICTGGTGGHVIPAINFGNYLLREGYECILILDKRGYTPTNVNGGSKKIISKSLLLFSKKILADEFIIKALSALKLFLFSERFNTVEFLLSTNIHDWAFLDKDSNPKIPLPENKSKHVLLDRSWPNQLKRVSRTRFKVGLKPSES